MKSACHACIIIENKDTSVNIYCRCYPKPHSGHTPLFAIGFTV
jgi:hypothetical protein